MPRKNLRQTWGRYHAQVERNIERAHARRKARGIVENWERSGSEVSLGGVNSGICISDQSSVPSSRGRTRTRTGNLGGWRALTIWNAYQWHWGRVCWAPSHAPTEGNGQRYSAPRRRVCVRYWTIERRLDVHTWARNRDVGGQVGALFASFTYSPLLHQLGRWYESRVERSQQPAFLAQKLHHVDIGLPPPKNLPSPWRATRYYTTNFTHPHVL